MSGKSANGGHVDIEIADGPEFLRVAEEAVGSVEVSGKSGSAVEEPTSSSSSKSHDAGKSKSDSTSCGGELVPLEPNVIVMKKVKGKVKRKMLPGQQLLSMSSSTGSDSSDKAWNWKRT